MKVGWFFCKTWMMNYWYFIGWPQDKFVKYCEKKFNHTPDFTNKVAGKLIECENDDGVRMLIWVRSKKDLPSLAHECLHAANFTLARKGWRPELYNDEPQTYLFQAIFKHALEAMK